MTSLLKEDQVELKNEVHNELRVTKYHGPRAEKQKQPEAWSSGIMPPPFRVSIASSDLTTSSMSGRLSGCGSQHFRIMLANAPGQHLGISGRKFCNVRSRHP